MYLIPKPSIYRGVSVVSGIVIGRHSDDIYEDSCIRSGVAFKSITLHMS